MANTYYDSQLTAEEIEEVLEAINGILNPANNGKVLAISNGKFEARSVQWGGGEAVLEPLSVTANGDYTPEAGVDGFDEVHVAVPSSSPTIQSLSVTQNGTYTAPSGVDGYSPVTVNVPSGGGGGIGNDVYVGDFTPNRNASSALSGGWLFETINYVVIDGIRFFARDTTCSVYLSNSNGTITYASKTNVTVVPDQWNDIYFDSPVLLHPQTRYVVWGSHANTSLKYLNSEITPTIVTFVGSRNSWVANTFPSQSEPGMTYGVDLIASKFVPNLSRKQINEDGVYLASDDNVDGYDFVTVNVSSLPYDTLFPNIDSGLQLGIYSDIASPNKGGFAPSGAIQIISSSEPIDVTDLSTVTFEVGYRNSDSNTSGPIRFGVAQSVPTTWEEVLASLNVVASSGNTRYDIDVSALSGNYYLFYAASLTYGNYGWVRCSFRFPVRYPYTI